MEQKTIFPFQLKISTSKSLRRFLVIFSHLPSELKLSYIIRRSGDPAITNIVLLSLTKD